MNPTMKAWWQEYGLTAMLGTLAAAALVVLGLETDWGRAARPPLPEVRNQSGAELVPLLPTFKLGVLDTDYRETGERPLFSPSRRPPQANPAAAAPQMKRGQFRLAGTVVNAGLSVAYLVEVNGNKTVRVQKGAEVLGYPGIVVDQVDAAKVVLKQGEETEVLELRTAASPPKPAAPAGVPGQPQPPVAPAPVAAAAATTAPPVAQVLPPQRPFMPQPGAPTQPMPGAAVLPGFVAGAPGATPAADAAQPADAANPALRRRRFQNVPPQPQ
ncbi:MAG TPA: hypothetical protein VFV17_01730 [Usitatibacteraceae bacterium]|nr:hypothetical protein [Usitatibacteraceae bacterium]